MDLVATVKVLGKSRCGAFNLPQGSLHQRGSINTIIKVCPAALSDHSNLFVIKLLSD